MCDADACVVRLIDAGGVSIVGLHVDDIVATLLEGKCDDFC